MYSGARPEMIYMFTCCRMDALALGAAGAVLSFSPVPMRWLIANTKVVLPALFAIVLTAAFFSHVYSVYDPRTLIVGQSLLAAAFAVFVVCVGSIPEGTFGHPLRRLLETPALRAVGRYSFAMYVFHLPLLVAFGDYISRATAVAGSAAPLLYAFVAVGMSFVAGFLTYHLLEKHFLRLKSVLAPR
jgi:peptidoglycan/LPS O-acetylase OafA/YrhL